MPRYGEDLLAELETPAHREFRAGFRRFAALEMTPRLREWEEAGGMPREMWRSLGAGGFLCPWLSREEGGPGLDRLASLIVWEELVRAGAFATGVPLHSDTAAPYIAQLAEPGVREEVLPLCARGELVTAMGLTEPGAGSDLGAITTRAELEGGTYFVSGGKTFITNGALADLVVLAVKTGSGIGPLGVTLLLARTDSPGFSRGRRLRKMGCRLMDTAQLFFDRSPVPVSHRLGGEGMGMRHMLERLPAERLEVAASAWFMARRILILALEAVRELSPDRRPGQAGEFRMAELATGVELGRAFLSRVAREHLAGRESERDVSMAKMWLSELANDCARGALGLLGSGAMLEDSPLARAYRDVRGLTIYAGTNEVMKSLVARKLGFRPGRDG